MTQPRPSSSTSSGANQRLPGELLMTLVLGSLASWSLGRYLLVALRSLSEPQPLEWMEGGVVHTVQRVLDGEALYTSPTVEYVAYIYPPLYFWITAVASRIVGIGFLAGRTVSLVAMLACFALVFALVRRQTGRAWWGLVGAGMLAATFEVSGRWFHLARVDSLYQALLLGGFFLLLVKADGTSRSSWTPLLAGISFGAAMLTKQTALLVIAPLLVADFALDRGALHQRRALRAGLAFVAITLPVFGVLHLRSEGWSSYFLFQVAGQHPWAPKAAAGYWSSDLWSVALLLLPALIGLSALWQRQIRSAMPWLGLTAGVIASTWLSRAHDGGAPNVVMPAFLLIAVLAPIGLHATLEAASTRSVSLSLTMAVGLQFLVLGFDWRAALPTDHQRDQYQSFIHWVEQQTAQQRSNLLVPDARWLVTEQGVISNGLGMAARDLLRIDAQDRGRLALEESIRDALASGRYGAVVTSEREYLRPLITEHFTFSQRIEGDPPPIAGWPARNRFVYLPISLPEGSAAPR